MNELSLKFYHKFIDYGFDEYLRTFQDCLNDNPQLFWQKVRELKLDLDDESIQEIDKFINIVTNVPLPSRNFLIRKEAFFDSKDLSYAKKEKEFEVNNELGIYAKYNLQGFEKITYSVFGAHYGLKSLTKELHKAIEKTVFFDIGAFWGDTALMLSQYRPLKTFAFEPNSVNFELLNKTITNNRLDKKVIAVNKGASDKNESLVLNYISKNQNHGSSFVFKPKKYNQEICSLVTLDSFYTKTIEKEKVGLIKIDAEGFGINVIEGAKNIITNHKPIILCSIYHSADEFLESKNKIKLFNSEYKFKVISLSKSFILKELLLIAY